MTLANLATQMESVNVTIGVDEFTMMEKLAVTHTEAMIIKLIWYSGSSGINLAHIGRSARQHVYNLRPKLIKYGINIINMGGKCYGMPRASRETLSLMFNCGQLNP